MPRQKDKTIKLSKKDKKAKRHKKQKKQKDRVASSVVQIKIGKKAKLFLGEKK